MAPYSVERRRQAVEAFQASGLTQVEFARYLGIGLKTLRGWVARYKEHGSKGLERRRGAKRTAPAGGAARALPAAVRDEVAAVQRRFPDFGLRRSVHFLARFSGVKVSPGAWRRFAARSRSRAQHPSEAPQEAAAAAAFRARGTGRFVAKRHHELSPHAPQSARLPDRFPG